MNTNKTLLLSSGASGAAHPIRVGMKSKGFDGLGSQGMLFHQAVCELCDDSLAAVRPGEKARICVAMAPGEDDSYMHLAVADCSSGMNLEGLTNALQVGSDAIGADRMNEHGYGLKNALMCLSGASKNWCIYTHVKEGSYYYVEGPLDENMVIHEVNAPKLPEGLNICWENPYTVVYVQVPMIVARTVQSQRNRNTKLVPTLRRWLVEHLGVTYRGYLELDEDTQETGAKISATIGDDVLNVSAVKLPIMLEKSEELKVDIGGELVNMTYIHGILDTAKRDVGVRIGKGKYEKCRYYYQGNQNTQGIDIRIGRRIIATAQLKNIWCKKDGTPLSDHNSYNDFIGELQIPDLPRSVLTTLTSKTGINPADPDWDEVFEALAKYPPTKNSRALTEKELQKQWAERIQSVNREDIVSRETAVWPTATRIDVVAHNSSIGKYEVYELKARKGDGQDLSQLRMYWDGLVVQGIQPTMGMLIAPGFSDNLHEMAALMNQLPTPCFPDGKQSAPYNLLLATFSELKFPNHTK